MIHGYSFFVGGKFPTFNEIACAMTSSKRGHRGHAGTYGSMKKKLCTLVANKTNTMTVPKLKDIDLRLEWHEKNRRRDPDNVASSVKFVLDGMVDSGVISNDNSTIVKKITHSFIYGSDEYGVKVTVRGKVENAAS